MFSDCYQLLCTGIIIAACTHNVIPKAYTLGITLTLYLLVFSRGQITGVGLFKMPLSTVSLSLADDKSFKSREDFSSGDEYARYVRDCISMGMMVRCCEGYKEVRLGDIGRIMKVGVQVHVPLLVVLSGDLTQVLGHCVCALFVMNIVCVCSVQQ